MGTLGRFERFGEQFFNAGLAQPLASARQGQRIDWRLGLHGRFAGEHLPLRILRPLLEPVFA